MVVASRKHQGVRGTGVEPAGVGGCGCYRVHLDLACGCKTGIQSGVGLRDAQGFWAFLHGGNVSCRQGVAPVATHHRGRVDNACKGQSNRGAGFILAGDLTAHFGCVDRVVGCHRIDDWRAGCLGVQGEGFQSHKPVLAVWRAAEDKAIGQEDISMRGHI